VLFTEGYNVLGEEYVEQALPLPGGEGGYGHAEGHIYPEFQVGGLIPSEYANVLPITNLACDVSELYVGIRQSGQSIEFRRTVIQNGKSRKEIQNLSLPYPVTPQLVSAIYYPQKNGGELAIKLGKQMANAGGGATYELANFTVMAHPGTTSTRVTIGANQFPDSYVFTPGPGSQYNTDFTVVLSGSTLEFRSTYSCQEGDSLKTVNGKQSVQLPITPSLDQIDVSGSTITVYPLRTGTAVVPDTDIPIRVG